MLPRLRCNAREQHRVYTILAKYLDDSSSIVKTFAMQALADLTAQAPERRPTALQQLQHLTAHGTPAMRARGRTLLADLLRNTPQDKRHPPCRPACTR